MVAVLNILGRLPRKGVAAALVLALLLGGGWQYGRARYHAGEAAASQRWEALQSEARAKEEKRRDKLAAEHRVETQEIEQRLVAAREEYDAALRRLDAAYAGRLRQSDTRAGLYERAATAGADQCRDLAGHAARLDRSLEEGRDLVAKLASLAGQREQQLRLLGEQIRADRAAIEG